MRVKRQLPSIGDLVYCNTNYIKTIFDLGMENDAPLLGFVMKVLGKQTCLVMWINGYHSPIHYSSLDIVA